MGTVAVSEKAILRRVTKPHLQAIFHQYSADSEKCDGHESDHDENGNNNVHVSASIHVLT